MTLAAALLAVAGALAAEGVQCSSCAASRPPLPAQAAPTPVQPDETGRTASHLSMLAFKKGELGYLEHGDAEALGLPTEKQSKVRALEYPAEKTPDGLRRRVLLLLTPNERPKLLVWSSEKRTEVVEKKKKRVRVEAWLFLSTLGGTLKAAAGGEGFHPVLMKKADAAAPETRAAFEAAKTAVLQGCEAIDQARP